MIETQYNVAPPGEPTLVFLHEGLGSVSMWRDFPRKLASACNLGAFVFSRHGHGNSGGLTHKRNVRYMHDEALVALPELLNSLKIERPIFVGHSDGASIALIYAGAFPDSVRGLVLFAPHLFVEQITVDSIAAIRDRYQSGVREKLARHHRDVDATFWGWNDIWLDPAFRNWNIEEYARKVTAPVLAIQGEDDEYGTLAQIETLARVSKGPIETLILAGCGHSPHRDRGEFVIDQIRAWLVNAR